MMRRLKGFLAIAMLVCFTGCKPAETLDDTTRLIYLAPHLPCEAGEPGFGSPCFIKRKRDAVVVLRVPQNFVTGPFPYTELAAEFQVTDIALMPDKVLAAFEHDDKNEYVKQGKIAYRTVLKVDPTTPTLVKSFKANWGWTSWGSVGHERVRRFMSGREDSRLGAYVEIAPRFVGFKSYDEVNCLNQVTQYSTTKGKMSPNSPCDHRFQYHLPLDRPDTYMDCEIPDLVDGKLGNVKCLVTSALVLKTIADKNFYLNYSYYAPPEWLASGDWRIVDKRLQEWIKSIDVTDQYLQTGVKK